MNKKMLLLVGTVFFGGLFLIIAKGAMATFEYRSVAYWARIVVFWGLFGGFTAISAFFLERRYFGAAHAGIVGLYFVIFGLNHIYAIAGGVFLLFSFIYGATVRREKEQRLKVTMQDIAPRGLYFFITGVIVLISVVYYFLPVVQAKSQHLAVPENVEQNIVSVANRFILETSSDAVKQDVAENDDIRTAFEARVESAVAQVLSQAQSFIKPYVQYVPVLAAVGFFLAMSAFMVVWKLLVVVFSLMWYVLLRAVGFIKIETVQKEVEEARL